MSLDTGRVSEGYRCSTSTTPGMSITRDTSTTRDMSTSIGMSTATTTNNRGLVPILFSSHSRVFVLITVLPEQDSFLREVWKRSDVSFDHLDSGVSGSRHLGFCCSRVLQLRTRTVLHQSQEGVRSRARYLQTSSTSAVIEILGVILIDPKKPNTRVPPASAPCARWRRSMTTPCGAGSRPGRSPHVSSSDK